MKSLLGLEKTLDKYYVKQINPILLPNEDLPIYRLKGNSNSLSCFDFETTTETGEVYSWGLLMVDEQTLAETYYAGRTLFGFMKRLYLLAKQAGSFTIKGYNNGNFDNFFILKALSDFKRIQEKGATTPAEVEIIAVAEAMSVEQKNIVLRDGRILQMTLTVKFSGETARKIKIEDSRSLLSPTAGLRDNAVSFGLEVSKGDWDYSLVKNAADIDKLYKNKELLQQLEDYQYRDCKVNMELLKARYHLGCGKLTTSGEAFSIFQTNLAIKLGEKACRWECNEENDDADFENVRVINKYSGTELKSFLYYKVGETLLKKYFPTLKPEQREYLSKFYRGGYSSINIANTHDIDKKGIARMKLAHNLKLYDIVSNYPTAMHKMLCPVGKPTKLPKNFSIDKCRENKVYFIQILIKSAKIKSPACPPIIPKYNPLTNAYTTGYYDLVKNQLFFGTDAEIRRLEKYYHIEYSIVDGLVFTGIKTIFHDYIGTFIKIKSEAPKNSALREVAKLFLNGLYGKFGSGIDKEIAAFGENKAGFPAVITVWSDSKPITQKQAVENKKKKRRQKELEKEYAAVLKLCGEGKETAKILAALEKIQIVEPVLYTKYPNISDYEQNAEKCLYKANQILDDKFFLPVAIMTTAIGRENLFDGIDCVGWDNVCHCDTDSLKIINGHDLPKKICHKNLGGWENDGFAKTGKFAAAKCNMIELVDKKGKSSFKYTTGGLNKRMVGEQIDGDFDKFSYSREYQSLQKIRVEDGIILQNVWKKIPHILDYEVE